jgi:citrate synthase
VLQLRRIEDKVMDVKTGANIKTGTLTIGDKSWSFPLYDGTIGPQVIDISKLYAEAGAFTYDPGFTSTASCESKITYIDGDEGVLLYRRSRRPSHDGPRSDEAVL